MKSAFFNKGMVFFPATIKDGLSRIAPEGFNQNNAVVIIHAGTMSSARIAAKAEKTAPSDTKKRQDEISQETDPVKKAVLQKALDKSLESPESKGPAIQQTVDYITGLHQQVQSLPEGSPERQVAQEKLDYALSQAKQDTGLWNDIKSTVSNIGSAVSAAVTSKTSTKSYTLGGKPFDMEAAKKATGLSEAQIVKQAGLQ
jgi:hypothetical protein